MVSSRVKHGLDPSMDWIGLTGSAKMDSCPTLVSSTCRPEVHHAGAERLQCKDIRQLHGYLKVIGEHLH